MADCLMATMGSVGASVAAAGHPASPRSGKAVVARPLVGTGWRLESSPAPAACQALSTDTAKNKTKPAARRSKDGLQSDGGPRGWVTGAQQGGLRGGGGGRPPLPLKSKPTACVCGFCSKGSEPGRAPPPGPGCSEGGTGLMRRVDPKASVRGWGGGSCAQVAGGPRAPSSVPAPLSPKTRSRGLVIPLLRASVCPSVKRVCWRCLGCRHGDWTRAFPREFAGRALQAQFRRARPAPCPAALAPCKGGHHHWVLSTRGGTSLPPVSARPEKEQL